MITNERLRAMTPAAIFRGVEAGTLQLPSFTVGVDGLPALPPGAYYTDLGGLSFRQFETLNGNLQPDETWSPEDGVAWFMDERV